MKKIIDILSFIPFVIIAVILVIIGLPFIIILLPFSWLREKKFIKEYHAYLHTLEGKNFFFYNNRKKGLETIEQEIIPGLPEDVEPVYLNGRKFESEIFDTRFSSKAFYDFKNYTRFPHLLKIRNGKAIDISLNNEFFNYLNNGKSKSLFDMKMKHFFDLK